MPLKVGGAKIAAVLETDKKAKTRTKWNLRPRPKTAHRCAYLAKGQAALEAHQPRWKPSTASLTELEEETRLAKGTSVPWRKIAKVEVKAPGSGNSRRPRTPGETAVLQQWLKLKGEESKTQGGPYAKARRAARQARL